MRSLEISVSKVEFKDATKEELTEDFVRIFIEKEMYFEKSRLKDDIIHIQKELINDKERIIELKNEIIEMKDFRIRELEFGKCKINKGGRR